MNNPTERGTDDPTGYAPMVGMSYEIVREALENPSCVEHSTGDLTWRDHEAGEAIAALDRIEAKNLKQASSLLEAWAACEGLEAENERLRAALEALSEWSLPRWEPDDPQTEGEEMRLYALAALSEEPDVEPTAQEVRDNPEYHPGPAQMDSEEPA